MNKTLVFDVFKFLVLIIFILISLEFLLRLYSKIKGISFTNDNRYLNIYRVYHEGGNYNPKENFYLYKENIKEKRFLNFYFDNKKKKLIKIWDYNFSTNNLGLLQSANLNSQKKSILFLGDSFTQGTGSEPWLDDLSINFNKYQIVNGGMGATGFIQFSNLNDYLSTKLNIKKRVIIFISQDIRRNITIFKDTKCLIDHFYCTFKSNPISIPKDDKFNIEDYLYKKILQKNRFNRKKN